MSEIAAGQLEARPADRQADTAAAAGAIEFFRQSLVLAWPALCLGLFFLVPFALLLAVSLGHRDPQGLWSFGFEFANFGRIFDRVALGTMAYTTVLAVEVAAIATLVGFPLTYFITRLRRRSQIVWLILLLSTLCLSEVLIAFSWQVMLAKRIGVSGLFVWLGLLSEPQSLSPGYGAVLACLVYLVIPYTVLLIYPALSRLDKFVPEAAQTMGASPFRVFLTVVIPMMRAPLISSTILATIFSIGTFIAPAVLGRPEQWTIAILIGRAAVDEGNMPYASAMAIFLMVVTGALTALTFVIGRERAAER